MTSAAPTSPSFQSRKGVARPAAASDSMRAALAIRSVCAWLLFAGVLLAVCALTNGDDLDSPMIARALVFSSPLLLLVARGHLGARSVSYPTVTLATLVLWELGLGPSMVTSALRAPPFVYSEDAVLVGGFVFAAWWWVYAIVAGPAPAVAPTPASATSKSVSRLPYFGIVALWAFVTAWSAFRGHLSNYDQSEFKVGGFDAAVAFFYITLTPLMPSIAVLAWHRWESATRVPFAIGLIVAAMLVLFLSGGRSQFVYALLVIVILLRPLGAPFRLLWLGAALGTLNVLFIALIAYRTALQDTNRAGSSFVKEVTAASSAVSAVSDPTSRAVARVNAQDNVKSRLAYAPQYFVAVSHVLARGANLSLTMMKAPLQVIPTVILPNKNALADEYDLENNLQASGSYPPIDLSPSPILEWVFDFGVFIAPFGGALFGLLARFVDGRLARSREISLASWILLGSIARTLQSFEGGTDGLLMGLREPLALAGFAALLAYLAKTFTMPRTSLGFQ